MPPNDLVAEIPKDGSIPPALTVKQLKRGAAALKTFGIHVHIDYTAWQEAIAASQGTATAQETPRRAGATGKETSESKNNDSGPSTECNTEVIKEIRQSHSTAIQAYNGPDHLNSDRSISVQDTSPSPEGLTLKGKSSSDHVAIPTPIHPNESIQDARQDLASHASPSSSAAVHKSYQDRLSTIEGPLRSGLLPDLPARLRLLKSHHNYHHFQQQPQQQQQQHSSSPSRPPSQQTDSHTNSAVAETSEVGSAAACAISASPSILKKSSVQTEDAASSSTLSSCRKRGKMVRIATSASRPRRQSSPKPPNSGGGGLVAPKNLQRSARHAQDYRSSYVFDHHRQQEEMRRRRILAEDLVRREIIAQREADRSLHTQLELQYYRAIQECQRQQEEHLKRFEEQAKLLREYGALRLAQSQGSSAKMNAQHAHFIEGKKNSEETLRASTDGEHPKLKNITTGRPGSREQASPFTRPVYIPGRAEDVEIEATRRHVGDSKPRSRSLPRPRSAHLRRRGSSLFGIGFGGPRQSCDEEVAPTAAGTTSAVDGPHHRGRSPSRGRKASPRHRLRGESPYTRGRGHDRHEWVRQGVQGRSRAGELQDLSVEVGAVEHSSVAPLSNSISQRTTGAHVSQSPKDSAKMAEAQVDPGAGGSGGKWYADRGRGRAQQRSVGEGTYGVEEGHMMRTTNRIIRWASEKLRSRGAPATGPERRGEQVEGSCGGGDRSV